MKKPLTLAIASLILGGCASKDVIFTQTPLCQAPIATISLQNITQNDSQTTIAQEEYKTLLTQILQGTNCLTIASNPQERAYALSANYEVNLDTKEKKETLSSQSTHTLTAKVKLTITSESEIRQEMGESTIQAQEKRVLGMGESEQISREDEINALRNSTLIAIKNFIKSLKQPQE